MRLRGFAAVREYSLKFDGAEPREISKEELEAAASRIDPALLQAFQRSAAHIRAYQQELLRQVKSRTWESPIPGGTVGQMVRGLARVGIYVPGGTGGLPQLRADECGACQGGPLRRDHHGDAPYGESERRGVWRRPGFPAWIGSSP